MKIIESLGDRVLLGMPGVCHRRSRLFGMFLLVAMLALASRPAAAAAPALGGTAPYGAQRGTEVEVQFNGARLADAQEILFYEPGIQVTHLEAAGPNAVKAKLAIAPDCRLGLHPLRVRTATGVSNLRTFSVGALPEISETEPNSEFDQPQKIALGTTVNGVVENEDVDYFAIEAKKGERITAEIEGLRLGETFFDPYVAILDAKRFVLPRSDDAALVRQDCVCSIVAPEDGTYIIQVRETSFGGNGSCLYRLHVGRFPRPTGRAAGRRQAGRDDRRPVAGRHSGPKSEKVSLPATPPDGFGLFAHDEQGDFAFGQPVAGRRPGQRARSRAEQRHWRRPRLAKRRSPCNGVIAQAGRRRLLQVRG